MPGAGLWSAGIVGVRQPGEGVYLPCPALPTNSPPPLRRLIGRRASVKMALRSETLTAPKLFIGGSEDMTKAAFRSMIEEILSVDPGSLRDTDTRMAVKNWTSLADVQIMTVMASDLGLQEDAELLDYETIGELFDLLERRGAFGP
jgi:hypothetical protein